MNKDQISTFFKGEIQDDNQTLEKYSRDASLLKVRPQLVLYPKDVSDLKNLVNYVREHKSDDQTLSITGRAAGTDMSGGPLNESLVLDFTKHFTQMNIDVQGLSVEVEPGVFYRDFESRSTPEHISFPVYPASKALAAFGGMLMNNCAGEKTLRYGQMRDFVQEVSMVLTDGNEYTFKKITETELEAKKSQNNFEGEVYRDIHNLIIKNQTLLKEAKPKTSKNSAGYALWNIWDPEQKTFDLAQLFVGSQGTLGLCTKAKIRLIPDTPHRKLIALFFKSWDELPSVVNSILPFDPESLETFDDTTMMLGFRFMPEIARKIGDSFFRFIFRFLPEFFIGLRMLRLPKLVVLVELAENDKEVLDKKVKDVVATLKKLPIHFRVTNDGLDAEKYWIMRRESFSILRKHVGDKQTAPFIDDFAIDPTQMPIFLPKLLKILKDYGIKANIAGHAGNGNYHIIPLMDLSKESERAKIVPVSEKVYDLIIQYGGTITAEHNDGIIRTPFIKKMFGEDVYALFEKVKNICDPQNIFNPGKKVGGSIEYIEKHIAEKK